MFNISRRKVAGLSATVLASTALTIGASSEAWGGRSVEWDSPSGASNASRSVEWDGPSTTTLAGRSVEWDHSSDSGAKSVEWD